MPRQELTTSPSRRFSDAATLAFREIQAARLPLVWGGVGDHQCCERSIYLDIPSEEAPGFINDTVNQATKRAPELPPGMQQIIHIDVRGQILTKEVEMKIRNGISEKSNGLIKSENIEFRRK